MKKKREKKMKKLLKRQEAKLNLLAIRDAEVREIMRDEAFFLSRKRKVGYIS